MMQPEIEVRQPREIIHQGNYDIVVNWEQGDIGSGELQQLVNNTKDRLRELTEENLGINFFWPVENPNETRWMVDNLEEPRYFAKAKYGIKGHPGLEQAIKLKRKDLSPTDNLNKTGWYGLNSVMREMDNTNTLRRIVHSQEMQDIMNSVGYSSLEYVEPLIGIIDRNNGKKIQIYRYISDGIDWIRGLANGTTIPYSEGKIAYENIRDLLLKGGIAPMDLSVKQFMFSKEHNTLYLIDAEGFAAVDTSQIKEKAGWE